MAAFCLSSLSPLYFRKVQFFLNKYPFPNGSRLWKESFISAKKINEKESRKQTVNWLVYSSMGGGVSKETKALMLDAVTHGENFRVRRLIATVNSERTTMNLINSLTNRDGISLLSLAVESGDCETVNALLMHKADPNRKNAGDNSTPLLRIAAIQDELHALEISRSLLDAKALINHVNIFGQTALYQCAGSAGNLLVKYLLDRGASASHFCPTFSKTLLFHCVEQVQRVGKCVCVCGCTHATFR
jgi:hypothetical protein